MHVFLDLEEGGTSPSPQGRRQAGGSQSVVRGSLRGPLRGVSSRSPQTHTRLRWASLLLPPDQQTAAGGSRRRSPAGKELRRLFTRRRWGPQRRGAAPPNVWWFPEMSLLFDQKTFHMSTCEGFITVIFHRINKVFFFNSSVLGSNGVSMGRDEPHIKKLFGVLDNL